MSQILKRKVPSKLLFDFLQNNAKVCDSYYVFNNASYRKAKYHNRTTELLETIKEYYHLSKQHYTTRDDTYNNLITVIRQICKHNSIAYISRKEYQSSSYDILYHIYK